MAPEKQIRFLRICTHVFVLVISQAHKLIRNDV